MPNAMLIDDDPRDLEHARRLDEAGLACRGLLPSAEVSETVDEIEQYVEADKCDVLLLDYRLDSIVNDLDGARRTYRGGQLAVALRERLPTVPLVLVTTEQRFEADLAQAPRLRALYDHQILKGRLAKRSERRSVILELEDLALGYRSIREIEVLDPGSVASLLDPTYQRGRDACESISEYAVDSVADWILEEFLRYRGPLLSETQASSLLGIAPNSFRRIELQEEISDTRYRGPFCRWKPRWWAHSLDSWLAGISELDGNGANETRATAIARHLGVTRNVMRKDRCNWCQSENVSLACAVCQKALDSAHGLAVLEDIPHWATRDIVCYECIASGSADSVLFHRGADAIVEALKTGKLAAGIAGE